MNLYTMLKQREQDANPVRIGVIGAGKFSSMFLSQARFTPGLQIIGIADLAGERVYRALETTGWEKGAAATARTSAEINDLAAAGIIGVVEDSRALIESDCDVIMEITGSPEAGTRHALQAIEAGKHVVMVNVEADCLLGPVLARKARENKVIYTMAYGDQPALIMEQLDWAQTVGFEIVCAGKGTRYQPEYRFSTPETVWGFYGFSEDRVASGDYNAQMFNSFLDGSKSAIEMCAVANASGLLPQKCGLQFPAVDIDDLAEVLKPAEDGGILEHSGTVEVVASEYRDGSPVPRDLRWGVYVVFKAKNGYAQRCFQEYGMKTDRSGVYSALYRPYHYIGLELGVSAVNAVIRNEPTGSSTAFIADVGAFAKKDLKPGDMLDGEGGYTVFGGLLRAQDSLADNVLPLGLTGAAKVVKAVAQNAPLTYDCVEIDASSLAYQLRKEMEAGHAG